MKKFGSYFRACFDPSTKNIPTQNQSRRLLRFEGLENREMLSASPINGDIDGVIESNVIEYAVESDVQEPVDLTALDASEDTFSYEVESESTLQTYLENSRLVIDGEIYAPITFAPQPESLIFNDSDFQTSCSTALITVGNSVMSGGGGSGGSGGGELTGWDLTISSSLHSSLEGLTSITAPLLECRQGLAMGNFSLEGVDYLKVTLPDLPDGYYGHVTLSGTATINSDYAVYHRVSPDIGFMPVGSLSGFIYDGSSGGSSDFYIIPINNSTVQTQNKTVTLKLNSVVPYASGGDDNYIFWSNCDSATATLVDDDRWEIDVTTEGNEIAKEKLPGITPTSAYYTFTRTSDNRYVIGTSEENTAATTDDEDSDEAENTSSEFVVPGDLSYSVTVYFEVLCRPSDDYYCAAYNTDYTFSTTPLNDDDDTVYLENFQYTGYYDTIVNEDGITEYWRHYRGTIPAEKAEAKLRLDAIWDWLDEGDRYDLIGSPEGQIGEKVRVKVTKTEWSGKPLTSDWKALGENLIADAEIKDGGIFKFYYEYDGNDRYNTFRSNVNDTKFVPLANSQNSDAENGNNTSQDNNSDKELRKLKIYTWLNEYERNDGYVYTLACDSDFSGSSIRVWQDRAQSNLLTSNDTEPFYTLINGVSSGNDEAYIEGCDYGTSSCQASLTVTMARPNDETHSLTSHGVSITTPLVVSGFAIDLSIDSDNNGIIEQSAWEDFLESAECGLGKVIFPNIGDTDNDGYLDCWDGYSVTGHTQISYNASARFTPIMITIPSYVVDDLEGLSISLEYTSWDLYSNNYTKAPKGEPGAIRIWKKDGNVARHESDLIRSDVRYSVSDLGFTESCRTITLYVEGVISNRNVKYFDDIVNNEQQTDHIAVSLYSESGAVASDNVRYVVADYDTYYYKMALPENQDLRCAAVSSLVYQIKHGSCIEIEGNLNKFGLSADVKGLSNEKQLTFMMTSFRLQQLIDEYQFGLMGGVCYDYVSQKNVVAFTGTCPTDFCDDITDAFNYVGIPTPQYEAAFQLGYYIATNSDVTDFVFTGHSLGGGLASCCSIVANNLSSEIRNTYTFNAAGFDCCILASFARRTCTDDEFYSELLRLMHNYDSADSWIRAFILERDGVDRVQQNWMEALGQRIILYAGDVWVNYLNLRENDPVLLWRNYSNHLMKQVIEGMERRYQIRELEIW